MAGTPLELIAVEVRADLDQLERGMPGAVRIVDQSMAKIDASVTSTERHISLASSNIDRSMQKAGGASRVFGQQFNQVGQQVLAGTGFFQALAIQLPDIAAGMSTAGGAAGRFASFLGGPLGTALVLATSLAASLIPELLGIGDAADGSVSGVDALTAAIKRLKNAQGGLGDVGQAEKRIGELQSQRLKLTTSMDTANTRAERGQAGRRREAIAGIDAEISGLQRLVAFNDVAIQGKKDAAEYADKSSEASKRSGRASKGDGDAKAAAAKQTRELAAAQRELEQALDRVVGRFDPARKAADDFRATLAEIDKLVGAGRLGASDAIGYKLKAAAQQAATIASAARDDLKATLGYGFGDDNDPVKRLSDANMQRIDQEAQAEFDANQRVLEQEKRVREANIRTAATLYEDLFRGGSDAIWEDFKDIGLKVVASVLAQFTVAQFGGGGGGFNLGGAFSTALGAVFGFASGGSMQIGGRGGTDTNTLSLNGRPIANVSRGETLNVGSKALRGGGAGGTIISAPRFDLSGAIITRELYADMQRISDESAARAGQVAYRSALRDAPVRLNQYQRDGI